MVTNGLEISLFVFGLIYRYSQINDRAQMQTLNWVEPNFHYDIPNSIRVYQLIA